MYHLFYISKLSLKIEHSPSTPFIGLCVPSVWWLVRVVRVDSVLKDLRGGVGVPLPELQLPRAQGWWSGLLRRTGSAQWGWRPNPEAALSGHLLLSRWDAMHAFQDHVLQKVLNSNVKTHDVIVASSCSPRVVESLVGLVRLRWVRRLVHSHQGV